MSSNAKTCTRCTSTKYCREHERAARARDGERTGAHTSVRVTRPAPTPPRLRNAPRTPIDHDATYDENGNITGTRGSALSAFIGGLDDNERVTFGGDAVLQIPSSIARAAHGEPDATPPIAGDPHVRRALELVIRHTGLIKHVCRTRPMDLGDVLQNIVLHLLTCDDDNDTSDMDVVLGAMRGSIGRDDPEPGTCIINGADVTTHDLDGGTRYHDHAGKERSNSLVSLYRMLPASMRMRVRSRVRSLLGRPLDDASMPFMNAWRITRRRVNGSLSIPASRRRAWFSNPSPMQDVADVRMGMDALGVSVVHGYDHETRTPTRTVNGAENPSYRKVARIVRDVVDDVRAASSEVTMLDDVHGPFIGALSYHGDTPTKRRRHARRAARMNVGRTTHARRK